MKIIQLTDSHIGEEGEDTRGVDVRGNFLACLREITRLAPDRVVLSGDLCFSSGSASVYRWIRGQLERTGLPVECIPGNHDDPALLAKLFALEDDLREAGLYFSRTWEGKRVIFLDTSAGIVGPAQHAWLAEQLKHCGPDLLLFMHHPPLLSGVPYMDGRHALREREALLELLTGAGIPIHIFCGHYHVEKVIRYRNLLIHLTPSGFFQIDQHQEGFAVDHYRPGFRVITWEADVLRSTVRYLEGGSRKAEVGN